MIKIIKETRLTKKDNVVLLTSSADIIRKSKLITKEEYKYLLQKKDDKKETFSFNRLTHWIMVQFVKEEKVDYKRWENCRKAGEKLSLFLNGDKIEDVVILDLEQQDDEAMALAEGMALGSYQFLKYKSDNDKSEKTNTLKSIRIISKALRKVRIDLLNITIEATFKARDLVNEPVATLTAVRLSKEISDMGKESGAKVEVMNKQKIEALKMGGLLAVNRGSVDPPTFTIMEWKPENPVNANPLVLVGKGVVFDTGGLNLKPGNYMDTMKCDMAGAAIMSATVYAIAKAKLPLHVVALIPATDNRPSGNAYVPGDVITMYDGTTVEVLNTDAEGRLILADALAYAKKYNPALVIDAATLTGAAARAIGRYGIVTMEKDATKDMEILKTAGNEVYERLAEFPFWEEYGELIKSDVAEIKNVGGADAGMITAGKFLAHFTDYPFIHLDIAGPAFLEKKDSYLPAGGTGTGVRLLVNFLLKWGKTL